MNNEDKKIRRRPTLYDPKYEIVVSQAIARGLSNKRIAQMLNISESTFYSWMKQHESFKYAVESSEAAYIEHCITRLMECADSKDDWRAYAYMLAKKDPEEFGDKQNIEMTTIEKKDGNKEVLNMLDQLKKAREQGKIKADD